MTTFDLIKQYIGGELPSEIPDELESKKEMKKGWKKQFKADLESGINPLLAFQVLYHRLSQIADVAKDVFYDPAIKYIKCQIGDEKTDDFFGTKVTLKTSVNYKVIENPKIQSLKKEKERVAKKNEKAIKAYERYQNSIKSLDKQIKAEEENLAKQGMYTEKEVKETITLSY